MDILPNFSQSSSYVFKLKFQGETRKYGYSGPFPTLQVYNGLFDRTSSVFSLPRSSFRLRPVVRPELMMETYEDFQAVVKRCESTECWMKEDAKGRWVMVFNVDLIEGLESDKKKDEGKVKQDELFFKLNSNNPKPSNKAGDRPIFSPYSFSQLENLNQASAKSAAGGPTSQTRKNDEKKDWLEGMGTGSGKETVVNDGSTTPKMGVNVGKHWWGDQDYLFGNNDSDAGLLPLRSLPTFNPPKSKPPTQPLQTPLSNFNPPSETQKLPGSFPITNLTSEDLTEPFQLNRFEYPKGYWVEDENSKLEKDKARNSIYEMFGLKENFINLENFQSSKPNSSSSGSATGTTFSKTNSTFTDLLGSGPAPVKVEQKQTVFAEPAPVPPPKPNWWNGEKAEKEKKVVGFEGQFGVKDNEKKFSHSSNESGLKVQDQGIINFKAIFSSEPETISNAAKPPIPPKPKGLEGTMSSGGVTVHSFGGFGSVPVPDGMMTGVGQSQRQKIGRSGMGVGRVNSLYEGSSGSNGSGSANWMMDQRRKRLSLNPYSPINPVLNGIGTSTSSNVPPIVPNSQRPFFNSTWRVPEIQDLSETGTGTVTGGDEMGIGRDGRGLKDRLRELKKSVKEDQAKLVNDQKGVGNGEKKNYFAPALTNVFEAPKREFASLGEKENEKSQVGVKVQVETVVAEESEKKVGDEKSEESVDKVEGIKSLVKEFVKNFNKHVSENFGDVEIPCLEFNEDVKPTAPTVVVDEKVEVKEEEKEEKLAVPGAFKVEEEVTPPVKTDLDGEESEGLHPNVWCDICLKTIRGIRHRCQDCTNYDLCTLCFSTKLWQHTPTHVFDEVEPPKNVKSNPFMFGGFIPRRSLSARRALKQEQEHQRRESVGDDVAGQGPLHNASCDLCECKIRGTRFKCLNCPDFDMCPSCYRLVHELHPKHNLIPIADPNLVTIRISPEDRVLHSNVVCDACDKEIRGIRYKCTDESCEDFDLCAACEASPIPRHDPKHLLLKIKTPIIRGLDENVNRGIQIARSLSSGNGNGTRNLPVGAQLVDGPGNEKTLYVDVDAEEIAKMGIRFPSEIKLPITFNKNEAVTFPIDLGSSILTTTPANVDNVDESQNVNQTVDTAEETKSLAESFESMSRVHLPTPPNHSIVSFDEYIVPQAPIAAPIEVNVESITIFEEPVEEIKPREPSPPIIVPSPAPEEVLPLQATFKEDITLEDGTIVPAGALFNKCWKLVNNGPRDWPVGSKLVFTGGFGKPSSFLIPAAKVGEIVEVEAKDVKAPDVKGHYLSFWRLVSPDGSRFGDKLWIDIIVEDESSVNSSLSSSFLAPSLNAAAKATTEDYQTYGSTAPSTGSKTKTISTFSNVSSEEGYGKVLNDEDDGEFILLSDSETEDDTSSEEEWRD